MITIFKIFENIKFIDIQQSTLQPLFSTGTTTQTTNTGTTTKVENTPPPQFDANGIPIIDPNSRGQLDYYRNLVVYCKQNLNQTQLNELKVLLTSVGSISYYLNGVFVVSRVKVENIALLQRNTNITYIYQMKLDFGWTVTSSQNLNIISGVKATKLTNNDLSTS